MTVGQFITAVFYISGNIALVLIAVAALKIAFKLEDK